MGWKPASIAVAIFTPLNTAFGFTSSVALNSATISAGKVGFGVMEGVSVIVGVRDIVGVREIVGVKVIVGVRVTVGEGGKY